MVSEKEIIKFINARTGDNPLDDTDINGELRIEGDDFDELMKSYSEQFKVDMSDYWWYFHHEEEGFQISLGRLLFKPPNLRVERIPVTPTMLADFANKGKWDINYPAHKIPAIRFDMILDWIFTGIFLVSLIWFSLKK